LSRTNPNLPDDPAELKFGHSFTDHMLSIQWTSSKGWEAPKISKLKNLEIHPAAKCLHYSIEIFEGMKAYYGVDKKLRLFRPDLNMNRFHKSALRSALPVKFSLVKDLSFDKIHSSKILIKRVLTKLNY